MTTEAINHTVYSLDAVFKAIEPYLKDEFSFDFDTNEGYPRQIGVVYTFNVLKRQSDTSKGKTLVLDSSIPSDATPEETEALVQAIQDIPVVKLHKTRRALAKEQTINDTPES